MGLGTREQFKSAPLWKEHEQADGNHYVEHVGDDIGLKVDFRRGNGQGFGQGRLPDPRDRFWTRVESQNGAATSGSLDAQIAEAATHVQDLAMEKWQRKFFEGIERKICLARLTLELGIEESNGQIAFHDPGFRNCI
jgi:hypothetical protein